MRSSPIAHLLSDAASAHAQGRLEQVVSLCEDALLLDPGNVQAMLLLGVAKVKSADAVGAIELLAKVAAADPTSFQAPFWLSVAFRNLKLPAEAIKAAEAAIAINPKDPQGLAQIGMCCLDARLLPEAEAYLRTAVELAPRVIQLRCSLSHSVKLQGREREALAILRSAIDAMGLPIDQLLNVGQQLLNQEYMTGAATFGREAIRAEPRSVKARLLLGKALVEDSSAAEAIELLKVAVKLDNENAEAIALLGAANQALGNIEEASKQFRLSQQLEPNQGYAYFALVHNRKVTEEDRPEVAQMGRLVAEQHLPPRQLSYLQYGLGKAHENLGEYGEAMQHYDEANRIEYELKFHGRLFDRMESAAKTDRTMSRFDRNTMNAYGAFGSESELPIFVVGMMRSGTTLAEQILSSHPEVGAAGEQSFWPDNWRQAMSEDATEVNPKALRGLAERYCGLLSDVAPGKKRVVDKLPGNTFGLGTIHLALPKAKIVHMRRHPVDTCLSIYTTPNRAHPEFAHDRENIVFAYSQYLRIMEHWRQVLPKDSILEVDYEDLVSDGDRMTKAMIAFCGLDWNESCLKPEANERSVVTPSVWQVRQPIYRTSTERWRRFEPWLGAFGVLLQEHGAGTAQRNAT